jgi:hypothetical protein
MSTKNLSMSLVALALSVGGCGSSSSDSSSTQDTSTSGSVASAVGGAYNGSSSSGTQTMLEQKRKNTAIETLLASLNPISSAMASTACPTFSSGVLASCISGGSATLTYSACSFGSSSAVWNGGVAFTCSGTTGNATVERAIHNGTTRTNSYNMVVTIDTSGLSTFNGASVSGGGTTFTPSSINIGGVQLVGTYDSIPIFNHTITTSSPLTLSNGTVTGQVTVYHNLAKVIGTSTVSVGLSAGCCVPTSGTIKTVFQAYGAFGARSGFNGATETLTFTGCGTATYPGPECYSGSVTLANCI